MYQSQNNDEQAVSYEVERSLTNLERAGEAGAAFCNEVRIRNAFRDLVTETYDIGVQLSRLNIDVRRHMPDIAMGVIGKSFKAYVGNSGNRNYNPTHSEQNFYYAFKQLADTIDNAGRQSSYSNNSSFGNDWNNNRSSNHTSPSFGTSGNSTGGSLGGSFAGNSGGGNSLLSRSTNTRQNQPNHNEGEGFTNVAKTTSFGTDNNKTSDANHVIPPLKLIPYVIRDKYVLFVDSKNIQVYEKTEADKMKLDYCKHELNKEFLEAVRRNGVLKPESHYEAAGNLLRAVTTPLEGIEGVKAEMQRLNAALNDHSIHNTDIDLSVLRSVKIHEIREGANVNEVVAALLHELADEGFTADETFADFSMDRHIPLFATKSDMDLLGSLIDCNNLMQYGNTLMSIKGKISAKVWFMLEQRLTTELSRYLCSTLPMFVELESFVDDYQQLNSELLKEFNKQSYSSDLQLAILTGLNNYINNVIGYFASEEITETTEVEDDPMSHALATNSNKFYQRVINIVRENYLMVNFNAANLRLTLPVLFDNKKQRAVIQPKGGVIDPDTMPALHKSLSIFMEGKIDGNCYLLTKDNYRCRISRSLLDSGLFVLDLPEVAV